MILFMILCVIHASSKKPLDKTKEDGEVYNWLQKLYTNTKTIPVVANF